MAEYFRITQVSFRKLFDDYYEPLCRYLAYYCHNRTVVEDIIQEVFVKLWEERDALCIESVKTYLFTSARNRMLNHLRDEKRHNTLVELWTRNELEKDQGQECFDIDEFADRIQTAINTLPEKCGTIFHLSKTQHLTYKQIAEKLNISVKTVETQMGIALRKIREHLSAYYPRINKILFFFFKKIKK